MELQRMRNENKKASGCQEQRVWHTEPSRKTWQIDHQGHPQRLEGPLDPVVPWHGAGLLRTWKASWHSPGSEFLLLLGSFPYGKESDHRCLWERPRPESCYLKVATIRTCDSRKANVLEWAYGRASPSACSLLSAQDGALPYPTSVHQTPVSCQSSSPILFLPGSTQGLNWESGFFPHSASELIASYKFFSSMTAKPLWMTLFIIITQGPLNYYPHDIYLKLLYQKPFNLP